MRIVLWILGILAAATLGFYWYMGGFHRVTVTVGTFGPVEFAYAKHEGSYANLSKTWGDFMPQWQKANLKTCLTMGVYLDKPGTPESELRSLIGCRIDGWTEEDKAAARAAFPTLTIPQSDAIMASFPFRNFLSFFYAPTRVYPEIEKKAKELGAETQIGMELYGSFDNITDIQFVTPIRQDKTAYQPLYDVFPPR